MQITETMIETATMLGACRRAIEWLSLQQRTLEELVREHPGWYLWAMRMDLPRDYVDACAKQKPSEALVYAAALLTPERLDFCAETDPWTALEYASELLTPERYAACVIAVAR